MKLCLNNRDELQLINLDEILYFKASGNYTDLHFTNAHAKSVAANLSSFEKQLELIYADMDNPFMRVGRSHIININHISHVNVPKQKIQFDIQGDNSISLPKKLCAELKGVLSGIYCSHSSQE